MYSRKKGVILKMQLLEKPKINLAAVRTNANMNQREWAKALCVEVSTIIKWEGGKSEPNASQLRKMSEISGIPIDFIFIPEKS